MEQSVIRVNATAIDLVLHPRFSSRRWLSVYAATRDFVLLSIDPVDGEHEATGHGKCVLFVYEFPGTLSYNTLHHT